MLPAETLSRTQSRAKQTESAHLFDHFGNVGREMMHGGTTSEPSVLAARKRQPPPARFEPGPEFRTPSDFVRHLARQFEAGKVNPLPMCKFRILCAARSQIHPTK